jgi:L-ascorbate metabolism protein UlaG (beta-lactamase superfamily)
MDPPAFTPATSCADTFAGVLLPDQVRDRQTGLSEQERIVMQITLVRNATLVVEYAGHHFLIDPMLGPIGAMPAVPDTPNPRPIPLTPVPESTRPLIAAAQTLILTHLHRDHFDETAQREIRKSIPVLAQPQQVEQIRGCGFESVTAVDPVVTVDGITVTRTEGQHGTGEIGLAMSPVSGFVFEAEGEPTLYIAGDTIWCGEVAAAIERFAPDVIVVNAGAGQFLTGDPITMTSADVASTHAAAPSATILAVHLDALAHCVETRTDLAKTLVDLGIRDTITIPNDGETVAVSRLA